ncbi:recombinase family protein [Aeromicrobium sp. YIM 150415]|nr:recombinase family protein [Aeromicrobium sp. YIM 150415]
MSTLDQARRGSEPEGLSIPAQRETNRRRALEMGALVVAEFVERGRSGRSLERPELRRMLEYIQDRSVDFVIGTRSTDSPATGSTIRRSRRRSWERARTWSLQLRRSARHRAGGCCLGSWHPSRSSTPRTSPPR